MEIGRYAVVVAALLIGAATAHAETYRVIQAGKKFDTKLIMIKSGDGIEFVNQDKISHNVYSRTKGHEFDLKVQTPGSSSIVTFDAPGKVQVRCAIHPRMKLTVNVFEQ